jgi:hypothetical protein
MKSMAQGVVELVGAQSSGEEPKNICRSDRCGCKIGVVVDDDVVVDDMLLLLLLFYGLIPPGM